MCLPCRKMWWRLAQHILRYSGGYAILPIISKVEICHLVIFETTGPKFTKFLHAVDRSSMFSVGMQCDMVGFAWGSIAQSISISKYTCSLQAWWKTTSIFDAAPDTITNLINVEHEDSILQDAVWSSYRSFWCMQSMIMTENSGLIVTRWYC